VGEVGLLASPPLGEKDFVEDAEDLVGIDGAKSEVVIGVAAIVEMKTAEHVLGKKPGHDLFDVLRGVVMAGIDENFGLWAGMASEKQSHAPVGDVGMVESWL